jgi:hypothetical protein
MAAALEDLVVRLEAVTNKLESLVKNTNICEAEQQELFSEITENSHENTTIMSKVLAAGTQPDPV